MSQVALSITAPDARGRSLIEARTEHGPVVFDSAKSDDDTGVQESITSALAEAVRSGVAHPLDVHRGVFLQRCMTRALADLPCAPDDRGMRRTHTCPATSPTS